MQAIVHDTYGHADVLRSRDIDRPVPRDNEVLVRVRAAGVGPDVWHMVTGTPYAIRLGIGLRAPRNPVPGWDVAGVVESAGSGVTDLKPGDEVFGTCRGSFAEYACARADRLAPKPAGLTFEQAAALPVSGVTALQALRDKARLREGQKVLVIGASGGVGTFAVQLAAGLGAEVTGVCGPTGSDLVRSLGAAEVIDYTRHEISGRYDAVLDIAGSRPLALLRGVLTPGGTLVIVGGEGGGQWLGMGRQIRAHLISPFLRQRLGTFVAVTRRNDLLALKDRIEKGALAPVVDRAYTLSEAAAALDHLTRGHPRGKIVLTVP